MRKYIIRIGLFVLSFAFGISVVVLLSLMYSPQHSVIVSIEDKKLEEDVKLEDVTIVFNRFTHTRFGVAVEFEVTNNTDHSFYYNDYLDRNSQEYLSSETEFKINGIEYDVWRPENGTVLELKPNETKIFRSAPLKAEWHNAEPAEIGFELARYNVFETYWSKPLTKLPKNLIMEKRNQK